MTRYIETRLRSLEDASALAPAASVERLRANLQRWTTEQLRSAVAFIWSLPQGHGMTDTAIHARLVEKFGVPPLVCDQPMEKRS